jgi:hypothetical protein
LVKRGGAEDDDDAPDAVVDRCIYYIERERDIPLTRAMRARKATRQHIARQPPAAQGAGRGCTDHWTQKKKKKKNEDDRAQSSNRQQKPTNHRSGAG